MWRTMRQPKWVAMLAVVLAVVVVFVLLGRWQLRAAFDAPPPASAGQRVPISDLMLPGEPLTEDAAARPVSLNGWFVPGDFTLVENRLQNGREGFWVVGHLAVADADAARSAQGGDAQDAGAGQAGARQDAAVLPGIAAAVGWAPDADTAAAAAATLDELARTGGPQPTAPGPAPTAPTLAPASSAPAPDSPPAPASLTASAAAPATWQAILQAPQDPKVAREGDPQRVLSMAPGQLVNLWHTPASAYYAAWLLITDGLALPAGLEPIAVVPVDESLHIDLLNVFYALEWVVFAVMALYLWWRMVRDEWRATQAVNSEEALAAQVRRELLLQMRPDER